MELALEALHREAVAAEVDWDEQGFGPERIADARQFTTLVRKLTNDGLRDYQPGPHGSAFSPSQLADYLADTCLQASSFLFAAGADADTWRRWCGLAGRLKALSGDVSYALQLCTIARCRLPANILAKVRTVEIGSYRQQAVTHIILSHDFLRLFHCHPTPCSHLMIAMRCCWIGYSVGTRSGSQPPSVRSWNSGWARSTTRFSSQERSWFSNRKSTRSSRHSWTADTC